MKKRTLYVGCVAIVVAGTISADAALGASGQSKAPVTTQGAQPPPMTGAASPQTHTGSTADAVTTARYGPKGRPPLVGADARDAGAIRAADAASISFLYGTAYQRAVSDGAFGYFTVAKPVLATGDAHSLAELAVQSSNQRQIVEVGWTVDRAVNGDADPHLFVFRWVNGVPGCYNGCGFVPYNQPGGPVAGMRLPIDGPGWSQYFTIRHYGTNWWIGFRQQWVGYFPDSLWGGTFNKTGLVQWFGEVAGATSAPCTDMGNGAFAGSTTAASILNMGFWAGPATAITTGATHPAYYTTSKTASGAMRYGGPGAC